MLFYDKRLFAVLLILSACRPPQGTVSPANVKKGSGQSANSDEAENGDKKTSKPNPDDGGAMDGNLNPGEQEQLDSTKGGGKDEGVSNKPGDMSSTSPQGLPAFCKNIKAAGDWKSAHAFYNANGKLEYPSDKEKNRIVDFSYAGYHYGNEEPPVYPVTSSIEAIKGDNTKHIQDAIDALGKRTADAKGIRGALLLKPGLYQIAGSLNIPYSGVVLRGSGRGSDPSKDTIIQATGNTPHQRTVLTLGVGSQGSWKSSSPVTNISDDFVQVGESSFQVENTSGFKVGDRVQIKHPSSKAWIAAIDGGGLVTEADWEPNSTDIIYNRVIRSISGKRITLDAPIYNHLDKSLTVSTMSKATVSANLVRESGIENLFVDIVTKGGEDENHAWDAISVHGAEDSWVRNITAKHYGQAGVVTSVATRITVDEAYTSDGVGIRTGGRFYNFNAYAFSQLVLFKNCHASDGRHNFISNGVQTTSGVVWYKCTSEGDSASEGHRRWTQAMLFDSIAEKDGGAINLVNRGDAGTSHGWGSAHSVVWNYSGRSTVQKPPTAQNYFISPVGKQGPQKVLGPGPTGVVEIKAGKLSPPSLYEAQLCERLSK